MARFTRLDFLNRILDEALMPIFSHGDEETVCRVADAVVAGGATVFEFTNRADNAIEVFSALALHCKRHLPNLILGAGSIVDDATAALFTAHGANFIVGPSFNERVARFCNRRKLAYVPGCQSATEIGVAEELGVEIVKLFPCEAAGGPNFAKQILGPSPWTRLLPTSLGDVSPEGLAAWFQSGACAIGLGRELIPKDYVEAGDYASVTRRVKEVSEWVKAARTNTKK
ncbi:MAG: bifunctional 4-hydroxy-2-oxoglutarate aldolase/2-dehydro-3-deoxy-phosphogluconate aldolase [Verrucomicrobiota bacterium]